MWHRGHKLPNATAQRSIAMLLRRADRHQRRQLPGILTMKYAGDRPYADPEKAARKVIEIANSVETVQDGRIYIELINGPFIYEHKASPAESRPASICRLPGAG